MSRLSMHGGPSPSSTSSSGTPAVPATPFQQAKLDQSSLAEDLKKMMNDLEQAVLSLAASNNTLIGRVDQSEKEEDDTAAATKANASNPTSNANTSNVRGRPRADDQSQRSSGEKQAMDPTKLSYSELQALQAKQTLQTNVYVNNMMHASYGLLGLITRLKLLKLLQGKTKFNHESTSSASSSSSSTSSASDEESTSHQRETLELLSHMQKNNQQMDPLDIPVSIAQQQALLAQTSAEMWSLIQALPVEELDYQPISQTSQLK